MAKTFRNQNLNLFHLVGKLFMLIPQFPRIIKNIKKAKAINSDSNESIGKIIESKAINHGNVIALKYEEQSYTYDEFNQAINSYANYLLLEGVKNKETVIAFLENRPELLFLIAACAKIGAIISLISLYHLFVPPASGLTVGHFRIWFILGFLGEILKFILQSNVLTLAAFAVLTGLVLLGYSIFKESKESNS